MTQFKRGKPRSKAIWILIKQSFAFTVSYWINLDFNQIFVRRKNWKSLSNNAEFNLSRKKDTISASSIAKVPLLIPAISIVQLVKSEKATTSKNDYKTIFISYEKIKAEGHSILKIFSVYVWGNRTAVTCLLGKYTLFSRYYCKKKVGA